MNTLNVLGGADIGGSCYLAELEGVRILFDCGVRLNTPYSDHPAIPSPETIDLIFLSHAHLDHIGALAYTAAVCRNARIFATPTTCDFIRYQLSETIAEYIGADTDELRFSNHLLCQLVLNRIETAEFHEKTEIHLTSPDGSQEVTPAGAIRYQLYVDKMIAGKVRRINFKNESAGTQQILEIVRMLLGLFCGVTVVYDEIDDGIHDVLLSNIISSLKNEINGQLIITTHNTMLLEEIDPRSAYIICVDYLGNKEIRCVGDFPLQNSNNARIKYLKGLLGGTPYIDGIDYDTIAHEIEGNREES